MGSIKKALEFLSENTKKERIIEISFDGFLKMVKDNPQRILRNIFQLFYDMVMNYVGEGIDEYPNDPESIGFVKYDSSKIFEKSLDSPFFADRLFMNRFVNQVKNLKLGCQQNRIYVFEGPPGCGKSTFLNALLDAFERYTRTAEGQSFEIIWEIDLDGQKIQIPCPNHDHPILIIPKSLRVDFLDRLLNNNEIKYKISHEKDYEWVFREETCTVCTDIFWALYDKLGSIEQILSMIKVRPRKFDRRTGEGITVFNPGDKPSLEKTFLTNEKIQEKLDQMFGPGIIKYIYSPLAKTNNGIYVLMDIKMYNKDRLLELHNVISEGLHKVGQIEERINSLFIALMNPEDKKMIIEEGTESFQERIQYNKIPYVLVPETEIKIYRSIFGDIDDYFLPRVLENFAKVIISSRLNTESAGLKEWLGDLKKYERYCDENGLLLKMDLYNGKIPDWLSEDDQKKFVASIRKKIIMEAEHEGNKGFSGRDSIKLFSDFLSRYKDVSRLITMSQVAEFFKQKIDREIRDKNIPKNFLKSLVESYDFTVMNEIKEALYFYNKQQIADDILNYLCVINHDIGEEIVCKYTGQKIKVTFGFLKMIGEFIAGRTLSNYEVLKLAKDIQQKYVELIAQDPTQKITETQLYQNLFEAYIKRLKEETISLLKNEGFQMAVKAYGSKEFETYETRIKDYVVHMIETLEKKFGYTKQGAKEVVLYIIEKKFK
jgi:predicted Ser/Thr protein kinase